MSIGALACAAPAGEPPSVPARAASTSTVVADDGPPPASRAAAETEPAAVPAPADRQRPLTRSALLAELEKAGLTPGAFPRLEELTAGQRLPVMEAFSKALGVECTGCHVSDKDYAAETTHKQLTRHMWNDFTVPLRQDGKQVFCDSCHQGSAEILHRADPASVSAFMKQEFVNKLSTSAGALTCESCHGSPFEPHVFEKRWGVKG